MHECHINVFFLWVYYLHCQNVVVHRISWLQWCICCICGYLLHILCGCFCNIYKDVSLCVQVPRGCRKFFLRSCVEEIWPQCKPSRTGTGSRGWRRLEHPSSWISFPRLAPWYPTCLIDWCPPPSLPRRPRYRFSVINGTYCSSKVIVLFLSVLLSKASAFIWFIYWEGTSWTGSAKNQFKQHTNIYAYRCF